LKVSADTGSLRAPLSGRASGKLTLKNTGGAPLRRPTATSPSATSGTRSRTTRSPWGPAGAAASCAREAPPP
jgi:hypothetical protein